MDIANKIFVFRPDCIQNEMHHKKKNIIFIMVRKGIFFRLSLMETSYLRFIFNTYRIKHGILSLKK